MEMGGGEGMGRLGKLESWGGGREWLWFVKRWGKGRAFWFLMWANTKFLWTLFFCGRNHERIPDWQFRRLLLNMFRQYGYMGGRSVGDGESGVGDSGVAESGHTLVSFVGYDEEVQHCREGVKVPWAGGPS